MTLEEMLEAIPEDYEFEYVDWGQDVGKEVLDDII